MGSSLLRLHSVMGSFNTTYAYEIEMQMKSFVIRFSAAFEIFIFTDAFSFIAFASWIG